MNHKTVAIKAAKEAGRILNTFFVRPFGVREKAKHDLVSDADYTSEKKILAILRSAFPVHAIMAEETGRQKRPSDFCWYVDPLDGTANFVAGIPYFSVSVALSFRGQIVLGVVLNPITNELFEAEKNRGAYLNGRKIRVSDCRILRNAILSSGFFAREEKIKSGLKTIEKLSIAARKVLINFSPALNLCNIARGRIDGLVDNGTTPEDHAAGSLIVTEAGGKIQNYGSNSWDVNATGIVASNGRLHGVLLKFIS